MACAAPTVGALAIFMNEAHFMFEWLLHHSLEGVSQFMLLDQNSTDNGAAAASTCGLT